MLIARPADIPSSQVTDESAYASRREFLRAAGLGLAALGGLLPFGGLECRSASPGGDDELTPYDDVAGYNNFYEFGTGKDDPPRNAAGLRGWVFRSAG